MRMTVVSSAPLIAKDGRYFAYAPYVAELALWAKRVDRMDFVCPLLDSDQGTLVCELPFAVGKVFASKPFHLKTVRGILQALFYAPFNFAQLWRGMKGAGHIHLRCPGNLPLMGCLIQTLFPRKCKSAKYAGNWDPAAAQPASYRFQKWWLGNTFLSRNMQVMAYGRWPGASRNVRPFFTATYREDEKLPVGPRDFSDGVRMVFVGTLSPGKRPLYAIRLAEGLYREGRKVRLDVYGNGTEKAALEQYVAENHLSEIVTFKGNRPAAEIATAYRGSHFVVLPSRSEGWPKAVAEGMFWGCVPLATAISCVPDMLGGGQRGILLSLRLSEDVARVGELIDDREAYPAKVQAAVAWSRQFTVDLFEIEIGKLLTACA